jgi:hypothetical protein
MWILLFLLSLLVNVGERSRMFLIGGTFVLVSGIAYFAFMAAWLNIFLFIGVSRLIQLTIAAVAGGMGALNVKDFFAPGTGPSLGIPERAKPRLYGRIRRILNAEDLSGALVGAVTLAVLVNTVELICTAGLPALYTHILAQRSLSTAGYYGYLAFYNLFYMLDDALVLTIGVVTLSSERLEKGKARWLKLVSGIIMLILAAMLAFRPTWLAM